VPPLWLCGLWIENKQFHDACRLGRLIIAP
jgi:hypothetical protein